MMLSRWGRSTEILGVVLGLLMGSHAFAFPTHSFPTHLAFHEFSSRMDLLGDSLDPTPGCDATCTKRKLEFRYLVYVGKQVYCYWDMKAAETRIDYDALAASLEGEIRSGLSLTEYYLLLRRWASSFHDGHVNVMFKNDMTGIESFTSPVRFEVLAPATEREKLIVSEVKDRTLGLSVGDEVLAISGVPTVDAISQAAAISSSGSTAAMRRFWSARRLADVLGVENGTAPFNLQVVSLPNKEGEKPESRSVSVYRNIDLSARAAAAPGTPEPTGIELITARVLPNQIGYLRLDGFSGTQDEFLISQAMDRLARTRGLILDLRKNGGGDLSGDRIIERLATSEVIRMKRSERISPYVVAIRPEVFNLAADPSGLFALWHDLMVTPAPQRYTAPVVALTSAWCFSACDTFTSSLKANGLATFVGEPTGGGTGTPLVFDLPSSPLQFRYSTIRGQDPRGRTIEGSATMPDIWIEPTVADRALGKDTQLEKAIEVIETKLAVAGAPKAPAVDSRTLGLPLIWSQSLDRSPTWEENELLLRLSARDGLD